MITVLMALAGGLGAVLRFTFDSLIATRNRTTMPLGTVVINVAGSLLLGFVTGWVVFAGGPTPVKTVIGTGLLGGFTTFSTASVETARLIRAERRAVAFVHATGMCLLAVAAAGLGLWLAA